MDEQKIIFSNRFEKEKFEDYKTDLGTDSSVTPDFTEADDFLKFIQKNRRSVPSKERIADKDKFIKTVYELSNSFEIDADLIEFAEGYIANIYVDYACYTGYIKKLLAILFILADDISFLDGSKENADMLFSFTYHTHHISLFACINRESSIVSFAYNLSIYSSKIGSCTYVLFIYTKKDAESLPRPQNYLALSSLTFDTSLCAASCFTSSTSLASNASALY